MLNLLIRDLNLTLKPYGLQVVELPQTDQNPRSSAVLTTEPTVLEHVPEPPAEQADTRRTEKRERLLRLMGR